MDTSIISEICVNKKSIQTLITRMNADYERDDGEEKSLATKGAENNRYFTQRRGVAKVF
jgi:hypothetical protein